jgi:hypothetical protein
MQHFGSGKSSERAYGLIGYFGLTDWWLTAFNEDERRYIQTKFQPLGSSGDSLTSGVISYSTDTATGLLGSLAGWFRKPEERPIAHRILDKAIELSTGAPVLDLHFLYQQLIETYYKDRDKPQYLDKAIAACRQQIALASDAARAFEAEYADSPLPAHRGYEQLAIILEKQGHFEEVIALVREAEAQGWAGDWAGRLKRCAKKLRHRPLS